MNITSVIACFQSCLPLYFWGLLAVICIPTVAATPEQSPFPDITFKAFSAFVNSNFSSKVSLATVLLVLFTMTDNPDLLSLHARQQYPLCPGEKNTKLSAWIKTLARGLCDRLGEQDVKRLFKKHEQFMEDKVPALAEKLDECAKLLDLTPYDQNGNYTGKLKQVSHEQIQPVLVICPNSVNCEDVRNCEPRGLLKSTDIRDVSAATLIKGTTIHKNVIVLGGECTKCHTIYQADHEHISNPGTEASRVYVNSAKYLKIGQHTWVDRTFSTAILNGMYSFHASASAYTEFWNNSYGVIGGETVAKITRRQVWQAFIQESIRTVGIESGIHLEITDGLSITEKTKAAFETLGSDGVIHIADGHSCSECTQKYKHTSDLERNVDPAALVGIDEGKNIPAVATVDGDEFDSIQPTENQPVDAGSQSDAPVKMIIIDGIVMGPTHCAADDCSMDLLNNRGGVFCRYHELEYGAKCRMRDCTNMKVNPTQACEDHQPEWKAHIYHRSRANLSGIKRMLQRPGETLPWQTATQGNTQPHDEETPDKKKRKHFFSPARFYCVETICAPCGLVIAWTKFARAESETNILKFLDSVYPTEESRPQYVCIDKACKLLRTSISNGSWIRWQKTTRFIVDTYHYINHRLKDVLCRTWCNPAPLNGSAPNLVVKEVNKNGEEYLKRAFNTQVGL